jgi:hypothetical protein
MDNLMNDPHAEIAPEPSERLSQSFSATLIEAEDHLKLPAMTFAPMFTEAGFLVVMRMATTIEPILNDALEAEIKSLRRHEVEDEGASTIAEYVRVETRFQSKAKLALDLGILTRTEYEFVDALMLIRHHYAHHVANLPLSLSEVIQKTGERRNDSRFTEKLFGKEMARLVADTQNSDDLNTIVRFGLVWMFSSFLSSALKVIRPKVSLAAIEASDTVSISAYKKAET